MELNSKIYIAGHNGMVGSSIVRELKRNGYNNLVYRSSKELDLTNQAAVVSFFETEKPEYVILAAAKVGGIHANSVYKGDFIYQNLMIQNNIIHNAYVHGVKKLLFLGSSCIYPKFAPQPIEENSLLTGTLEPTNEPYAIAKIAGIKLCDAYREQHGCNFISAMPTNLFGENDNYDLKNSHVLPAILRKMHASKEEKAENITVWGTGRPMREFLYVDDLAEACVFLMKNYSESGAVNIGTGKDISIKDLTLMIKDVVGFEGELEYDLSKPDGTPRKLLNVDKINTIGWTAKTSLLDGIKKTYGYFLKDELPKILAEK